MAATKVSTTERNARRWRRRTPAAAVVAVTISVLFTACAPPGEPPLEQVKRVEFGRRALADAERVAAGTAQPVLEFTVAETPPSIFVNFVVPDAEAAAFETFVDLPPGFSLAKVRILDSDPAPRYWVSLNVYRVTGLTTGLRAEWSTYVDDGSGSPRFMIVEARASEGSVDPLGPLALPEPFQHQIDDDGVIRTSMRRTVDGGLGPVLTADDLFNSTIALPAPGDRQPVTPALEWVAANDFIYWLNGVNDRTFYNSTAHSADLISVDLTEVTLDDQTDWAPFVDPIPAHVLVYLGELQFMIGPWWNITEPDGRVDEATLTSLRSLKKTMYGGLTNISAIGVLNGTTEPIVRSDVEATVPATHWHWRIPPSQLAAFAAATDLPDGLTLAPIRLSDADPVEEHWLTLTVQRVSGAESGLRAEWSTSVDDGDAVRSLVLDARADHPTLDPVQRFASASALQHTVSGPTLTTSIGDGPAAFTSSLPVPSAGDAPDVTPSRGWVGSSDLRYWSNGVGDRVFTDSLALDAVHSVDPSAATVSDGGRFAAFTATGPDRIWLDDSGTGRVLNPWWTLGRR